MIGSTTWARVYALALGVLLASFLLLVLVLGAASLVATMVDVNRGEKVRDLNQLLLAVHHWHHVLLLALAGIGGLATWHRPGSARAYALVVGWVFLLLGLWGFLAHWHVAPVGHRDLWLAPAAFGYAIAYVAIGTLGVVAGFVSPRFDTRILPAPRAA